MTRSVRILGNRTENVFVNNVYRDDMIFQYKTILSLYFLPYFPYGFRISEAMQEIDSIDRPREVLLFPGVFHRGLFEVFQRLREVHE